MIPKRTVKVISSSPHETESIGSLVGAILKGGDIVALSGELGTGKTTLVRGIAERMGCDKDDVASPSFTLINEYKGSPPLFHIDFYRLESERELYEIGYEEYIRGDGVVIIEWADRLARMVPKESLWITLRYLDVERREILIRDRGDTYKKIIEGIQRKIYNRSLP